MVRRIQSILVRPLVDADRAAIARWRYPGSLSIYDPGEGAMAMDDDAFFALARPGGGLLGYGTLGSEAQVPGGSYPVDAAVTDVGIGLRPDLVGRGLGSLALHVVFEEAARRCSPSRLRATVADANARVVALVTRLGFERRHAFVRARDGRGFGQYERPLHRALRGVPTLLELQPHHRDVLGRMLEEHLTELHGFEPAEVPLPARGGYPYVEAYFGEPGRHGFLLMCGTDVVGFAMVRSPTSTGTRWQIAEFFVRPEARGLGLGRRLVASLWRRFSGAWSLDVARANAAAVAFWRTCLAEAGCASSVSEGTRRDRVTFAFVV